MVRSTLLLEVEELVLLSSLICNRIGVSSEITITDSLNLQRLITLIFCLNTRRVVTDESMILSQYQEITEIYWLVLLIVALQQVLLHKNPATALSVSFDEFRLHLLNCCITIQLYVPAKQDSESFVF